MSYQTILLVDDDEDDQEIFLSALGKVNTTAVCVAETNARRALEKLVAKEITPDLIFLDLNMPVMNGQQFLLEIKKNKALSDIPVIIFSTTSHPATIQLTRESGAQEFITKPDKFDDLIVILDGFFN